MSKEHEELSVEVSKVRKDLDENKHVEIICNNECLEELEKLGVENETMKSSLEETNKTIAKFVEGEKKLNMLLNQ